jgi:membrane protein
LPNTKVALKNAGKGALLTAILWEAAKHLFTWYMGNIAHYKSLYGSLTTIVVFLLWIYYSASILLYGAEVVYQLGSRKRHITLKKPAGKK